MVWRVRFQAGSSTPLHLIGVELEKVGDDFGFVRVVRKADTAHPEAAPYHFAAKMAAFPVNAAITGKAAF